jgi:hypothetical protein
MLKATTAQFASSTTNSERPISYPSDSKPVLAPAWSAEPAMQFYHPG